MGSAINTSIEGEYESSNRPINDLGRILDHHETLDKICERIGTRKLSDFFDWSEMADSYLDEFADELDGIEIEDEGEKFFDPVAVAETASRLRDQLNTDPATFDEESKTAILEELNDVIKDAGLARDQGKRIALIPLP